MTEEIIVKKWGNSLAIILPQDLVKGKNIKEKDKIMIEIIKPTDLSDVFGILKGKRKMTGQEFKDFAREGW